jgi:hypothetical protein
MHRRKYSNECAGGAHASCVCLFSTRRATRCKCVFHSGQVDRANPSVFAEQPSSGPNVQVFTVRNES